MEAKDIFGFGFCVFFVFGGFVCRPACMENPESKHGRVGTWLQ